MTCLSTGLVSAKRVKEIEGLGSNSGEREKILT